MAHQQTAIADDIYLRKSLTIRGNPDDGVYTITGNAIGFSSAASESYNFNAANPVGFVQKEFNKHVYAAIEVSGRTLTLDNFTINAANSDHALRVTNRGKVYLKDVILNGRNYDIQVLNNSIITLNNTTVNTDGSAGRDA